MHIQYMLTYTGQYETGHSLRGRSGRDRVVVGIIATYAISAYHH